MKWHYRALFLLFVCLARCDMEIEEMPPNPDGSVPMQKLKFKAANLTEEEHFSQHMPEGQLMCDGCRAIVYQFRKALKKAQTHLRKGMTRMKESDLIDLFDETCKDRDEVFGGYGVKLVKNETRLSGEGLDTKNVPGMMQGGGKWPGRLREMCFVYIGEIGEDLMYNTYLEKGGPALEHLVCRGKLGNICPPKDNKDTKNKDTKDKSKEEL